jgi:hypothetical protein
VGGPKIVLPPGYDASQRVRNRIEEIFGWVKTVAGQAKTKFCGRSRVEQGSNSPLRPAICRIPKLLFARVRQVMSPPSEG